MGMHMSVHMNVHVSVHMSVHMSVSIHPSIQARGCSSEVRVVSYKPLDLGSVPGAAMLDRSFFLATFTSLL